MTIGTSVAGGEAVTVRVRVWVGLKAIVRVMMKVKVNVKVRVMMIRSLRLGHQWQAEMLSQ